VKLANTSFDNEVVDNAADGLPWELEAHFSKTSSSDFSISIANAGFVWNPDVSLKDIDITWRHYFKKISAFKPYAGIGYGFYRLVSKTKVNTCPSGYICVGNWTKTDTTTLTSGYNPHVLIGVLIPIERSSYSFILENKYEVSKENDGVDFSSNTIYMGIKWDF